MIRNVLAALLIFAATLPGIAQVVSIHDAKALGAGTEVSVSGVVINGDELGVIRYIQDNTGGLAVYDDVRDISWVANANRVASNTFGLAYNTDLGDYPGDPSGYQYTEQIMPDGSMTWGAALHWIALKPALTVWKTPTAA